MTTVACPRCRDEVMLPPHVSDDVLVRCPLCSEEYSLGEVTRGLPPTLVVVGPSPFVSADNAEEGELALEAAADAPRPVVLRESAIRRPASRSYPARRPKNPLVEILKIAGGGVIGLAIGQLILWWMPGEWDASNRDPANIATAVARYAPWIVPANLHDPGVPPAGGEAFPSANRTDAARTPSVATAADRQSPARPAPDLMQRPAGTAPVVPTNRSDAERGLMEEPETSAEPQADAAEQPAAELEGEAGDASPPPSEPQPDEAAAGDTAPAPVVESEGTPEAAEAENDRSVAAVQQALSDWDSEQAAASAGAALTALRSAAQVVSNSPGIEPPARQTADKLAALMELVFSDEEKLAALAAASRARPLSSVLGGEGVVLVGTLENVRESGDLWQLTVAQGEGSSVEVLAPRSVTPVLAAPQQVLVLGVLVEDAPAELSGYRGEATRAVFSRLVLPVGN